MGPGAGAHALQQENVRLKTLVAALGRDKAILQDVVKKGAGPALKREVVDYVETDYGMSLRWL